MHNNKLLYYVGIKYFLPALPNSDPFQSNDILLVYYIFETIQEVNTVLVLWSNYSE